MIIILLQTERNYFDPLNRETDKGHSEAPKIENQRVSWHNSSQDPLGHPPCSSWHSSFVAWGLLTDVLPSGGAGQASYELLSCQIWLCRGNVLAQTPTAASSTELPDGSGKDTHPSHPACQGKEPLARGAGESHLNSTGVGTELEAQDEIWED